MKNFSFVLIAFVLTLTFTASDITVEKGNKPEAAQKCPYLESLQQNQTHAECPFLKGTEEGKLNCPFLNHLNNNSDTQNGCPYLDGGSCDECPYFNHQGKEEVREILTHPLPIGRNT